MTIDPVGTITVSIGNDPAAHTYGMMTNGPFVQRFIDDVTAETVPITNFVGKKLYVRQSGFKDFAFAIAFDGTGYALRRGDATFYFNYATSPKSAIFGEVDADHADITYLTPVT